MKPLLYGGLALSLAANGVLAFVVWRRPAPSSVAAVESASAITSPSRPQAAAASEAEPASVPMRWRGGRADDDRRALIRDLRNAGFPPKLIHAAVLAAYKRELSESNPVNEFPYWRHYSKEAQQASQVHQMEGERKVEALLDSELPLTSRLTAQDRERKYGSLSDDKIMAIQALEKKFKETGTALALASATTADRTVLMQQSQELMKAQEEALAAVLTDDERVEYNMRNSSTAQQLANNVNDLSLAESEFRALYQARSSFEAANPPLMGTIQMADAAAREVAEAAYYEQAKAALGAERFYQYLTKSDVRYREVARLSAQFPAITPEVAYQIRQMQIEAQQTQARLMQGGRPDGNAIMAARTEMSNRLEALVGPAAAEAVRRTPYGSLLSNPTVIRQSAPVPIN